MWSIRSEFIRNIHDSLHNFRVKWLWLDGARNSFRKLQAKRSSRHSDLTRAERPSLIFLILIFHTDTHLWNQLDRWMKCIKYRRVLRRKTYREQSHNRHGAWMRYRSVGNNWIHYISIRLFNSEFVTVSTVLVPCLVPSSFLSLYTYQLMNWSHCSCANFVWRRRTTDTHIAMGLGSRAR